MEFSSAVVAAIMSSCLKSRFFQWPLEFAVQPEVAGGHIRRARSLLKHRSLVVKHAMKRKGCPLSFMAHLKRSIIDVKAQKCLAHAMIIAIAKGEKDPNYVHYRRGYKMRPAVQNVLATTGIDLSGVGCIPELVKFQENFRDSKTI